MVSLSLVGRSILDIVVTVNELARMRVHIVPPLTHFFAIIGDHIVIRQTTAKDHQGRLRADINTGLALMLIKADLQRVIRANRRLY